MAGSVDVVPRRRKLIRNIHNNRESNSSSASKLFMSIVTDDILWEILIRLPHAKYVIRCSLVSKRWHSLIHHAQFTAEFFRQSPRRIEGNNFELFFRIGDFRHLVYSLYSEKESETHRFYRNLGSDMYIKLSSSSLDLMVLKNWNEDEIHVCNPLTSQSLKIPAPITCLEGRGLGIVTDLENFGHYKLVVAEGDPFGIHVFCSRTGVWTHSRFSVPDMDVYMHNAISSQGVSYFPLAEGEDIVGVLVCSPLEPSRFRLVQNPVEGFNRRGRDRCTKVFFGVVSGRLRVSQLIKRGKAFGLKIWELRFDNQSEFESDHSWVLVHDVSLISGNNHNTKMFVVAFHPYNGDVIFMLRDYINICRYHNIRGEDKYEIIGQLPISNLREVKKDFRYYVKAFTLVHTPWPTPLGHKLQYN